MGARQKVLEGAASGMNVQEEEEEKLFHLCHHSKKLAIALGLMVTHLITSHKP
jgi:hypothetical protein